MRSGNALSDADVHIVSQMIECPDSFVYSYGGGRYPSGTDCFHQCGGQSGKCTSFCGDSGFCCKRNDLNQLECPAEALKVIPDDIKKYVCITKHKLQENKICDYRLKSYSSACGTLPPKAGKFLSETKMDTSDAKEQHRHFVTKCSKQCDQHKYCAHFSIYDKIEKGIDNSLILNLSLSGTESSILLCFYFCSLAPPVSNFVIRLILLKALGRGEHVPVVSLNANF